MLEGVLIAGVGIIIQRPVLWRCYVVDTSWSAVGGNVPTLIKIKRCGIHRSTYSA